MTLTPLLACPAVRSFATMRAAHDAVQTDRRMTGRIPYRCTTCRVWHVPGPELRDRRHRVQVVEAGVPLTVGRVRAFEQGHESTTHCEGYVNPSRGPAESLVRCPACNGRYAAGRGGCPWCATRERVVA